MAHACPPEQSPEGHTAAHSYLQHTQHCRDRPVYNIVLLFWSDDVIIAKSLAILAIHGLFKIGINKETFPKLLCP